MWPDYHGNRSPLADPSLKGAVVGLSLNTDTASLATMYLATLQVGVTTREVMMGEGNGVVSVIMLTFTKMPGPHADTAWAVVG